MMDIIAPAGTPLVGLRGLDVTLDNERLYIAAPAQTVFTSGGEAGGPEGTIVIVELKDLTKVSSFQQKPFNEFEIRSSQSTRSLPVATTETNKYEGKEPYNIKVTPAGILVTDRRNYFTGAGNIREIAGNGSNEIGLRFGSGIDSFDVNNAVGIVVTDDLQYAFVSGYNRYIKGQPSHDFELHPGADVGGNAGIINNPFNLLGMGVNRVIAATKPIDASFPDNLVLSPDGTKLFVAYRSIGRVLVFDVPAIRDSLGRLADFRLAATPIDVLDGSTAPRIIVTGGQPQGLDAQTVTQPVSLVNLTVEQFQPKAVEFGAKAQVAYKVRVENPSGLPKNSLWTEQLWVTDDGVLDGEGFEFLVGSSEFSKGGDHTLDVEMLQFNERLTPTMVKAGLKWVLRLNGDQQIRETAVPDSIASADVQFKAADLQVEELKAPVPTFGEVLGELTYTVKNAGTADTPTGKVWTEQLWIGTDEKVWQGPTSRRVAGIKS